LKYFSSNAKLHIIQNTWGPVFPPEETRVGQSAVVDCSPEYEEHFSLKNSSPNSIIHEIQEAGKLLFLTGEAEGGKSAASRLKIHILEA